MYDVSVSRAWMIKNNDVAARIVRGASTPESRRDVAQYEYEARAARLGKRVAWLMPVPKQKLAPGCSRTLPVDSDTQAYVSDSVISADHGVSDLYGAGRALERAIQEARFPGVQVNVGRVTK